MIEINGSHGEGGGQVLRTALALSSLTGKGFRIFDIRKRRKKPGLMRQHLVAVHAAAKIAGAEVEGDVYGSTEILFVPKTLRNGDFSFDIGTAGSVTLVLQTVILPLLFAGGRSTVILTGGTHVPFSPSFHYLAEVFRPVLARLGGRISLTADVSGFYPRGGGKVRCTVDPSKFIAPFEAVEPGSLLYLNGVSAVGNLPISIARRQRDAATALLEQAGHRSDIALAEVPAAGKGTFLFLRTETTKVIAGFTALGALGKRAETVGEEAARDLIHHYTSGAALDPHLADQLVPYLILAKGESVFSTSGITRHLLTNLWVSEKFIPFSSIVEGDEGGPGKVRIIPGFLSGVSPRRP